MENSRIVTAEAIAVGVIIKNKFTRDWWKCYSIITSTIGNKEYFFHCKGKTRSIKPKDFRRYTIIAGCSD